MKFIVDEEVFTKLPDLCLGVVVARGINNRITADKISSFLTESTELAKDYFRDVKVKEHPKITPFRKTFTDLGYNPNKFLCSIEALTSRVAKGGQLPHINNIVDIGNAVSLKWLVPIGAHDIDFFENDIVIRFSNAGDSFTPFGSDEAEAVEPGELVYVSGQQIKTRKWIWRQSELGKITPESSNIFFPIDGFKNKNLKDVMEARNELSSILMDLFDCKVKTGFVDVSNPAMEI